MEEIKKLLEGDVATPEVLAQNNYHQFGFHLNDPIYVNPEDHKIVVREDRVLRPYDFNVWDSARRL